MEVFKTYKINPNEQSKIRKEVDIILHSTNDGREKQYSNADFKALLDYAGVKMIDGQIYRRKK